MGEIRMKQIHIIMDGGIIQDIVGIPKDTEIIIRDYDMDFFDEDTLRDYQENDQLKRVEGKLCTEIVWNHNSDNQNVIPSTPAMVYEPFDNDHDAITESQERDSIDNPNGDGT